VIRPALLMLAGLASCATKTGAREAAPASLSIPIGERVLEPLADKVYTEPGVTPREASELVAARQTAQREVEAFFGTLHGPAPLVLFCHTAACKLALGADPAAAPASDLGFARDEVHTTAGTLVYPTVTVSGPFEATARVLAHEWVHAEMKAYAPYDATPTWLNEGLAAYAAHEPRCEGVLATTALDVRSLDTKPRWQAHLAATHATLATYCAARNEVSAWAESFASRQAMLTALEQAMTAAAKGATFVLPAATK
jgi:hypothetical protein